MVKVKQWYARRNYCKLLIDYLKRWGFVERDREQWLNSQLVPQHLDNWIIMICGCWLIVKDMFRKSFPELRKWNKGCRYRCSSEYYTQFSEKVPVSEYDLGQKTMNTQISWLEQFNNMFREPPQAAKSDRNPTNQVATNPTNPTNQQPTSGNQEPNVTKHLFKSRKS